MVGLDEDAVRAQLDAGFGGFRALLRAGVR